MALLQLWRVGAALVEVHGFLIVVASLATEQGLQSARDSVVASHGLQSTGLVVVVHGLS